MPAFLVSVRNSEEAATALAGGADVIDVKEPARGSLGRADAECWSQVVACVDGRVPVSVALGELTDYRPQEVTLGWHGVGYAKMGLSRCRESESWQRRWAGAAAALPTGVQSVAVVYADAELSGAPPVSQVLYHACRLGCWGILFDTFHKRRQTLLDCLPAARLADLVAEAHENGMAVAVAGSINLRNMDDAMELRPDLIAVRGAVCHGGRNGEVTSEKVRRLAQIVKSGGQGPDNVLFRDTVTTME